ncbi:MAG: hypothetical protein K2O42_09690 [Oscillospiraceae bacterium]|nr:hypothetical protein [Oscillospiraceae bacterium]
MPDVAKVLGCTNPRKALKDHVDKDDVTKRYPITDSLGRIQKVSIINESGLYSLVLASRLPAAKKFKHWVTSEVLPTIRKTGSYNSNPPRLKYSPYIYIENVNVEKIINQGEIRIEKKHHSYNPQGVKRIHVYKDSNGTVLAEKHITKLSDDSKKTCWYSIDPRTGRKTTGLNSMKMPLYHAEKLHANESPLV